MTNDDKQKPQVDVTLEDMELAWEHVRRSSRKEVKDWLALKIYGYPSHHSKYLTLLMNKLKQGEYVPSDAFPFFHPKTDRSLRRFEFLEMDDRIVYQYLCNRLIRNSFEHVVDLNSAHRVYGNIPTDPDNQSPWVFEPVFDVRSGGRTVVNGQYDLFRFRVLNSYDEFAKHEGQSWLVRTDIRSYYYSVDHEELLNRLEKNGWLSDDCERNLLRQCLINWTPDRGKGIPVGYECSDHMGNLYLNDLDIALMDFQAHRYVDDTYIFVDEFEEVKDAIHRFDEALESLGLQRNTSKTMTYCLSEFRRDELQKLLSESLSIPAEDPQNEVADERRHDELVKILEKSFHPHTTTDFFPDKIADIRHVAYVLNRLNRKHRGTKELAYYLLDHDLQYAYHAMKYLHTNHGDETLVNKLRFIVAADYEPRILKALALHYLQQFNDETVEHVVHNIVAKSDRRDWYLIRTIMKEVIEPSPTSFTNALLDSLASFENPHDQFYARWLNFGRDSGRDDKCKQISEMFKNGSQLVRKLGIYLAHRYGLLDCVDATLLEPQLQTIFPEKTLNEIENFNKELKDVFGIQIVRGLPFGEYFGSLSEVAPIMRVIYATKDQGARDFVENLYTFLEILLVNIASGRSAGSIVSNIDEALKILDDNQLYLLASTLRGERARDYVKEGIQGDLIGNFKSSVESWISSGLRVEVAEVRNQVFIAYARVDEELLERLVEHLQPIIDYHPLDVWSDKKIETGDIWREEINDALTRARVAVLLVTRPFLSSRFIHLVELPEILEASKKKQLKIIWVPVSPSNVDVTPITEFQAAWDDIESTLIEMNEGDQERHLVIVTRKIAKAMGVNLLPSQ